MFKKLILASAILAATTSVALANSGPYVGGSVGVNTSTFNLTNNANAKGTLGGRGAVGNIFAGYGAMVNQNIYLGGEAFVGLTNTSSDISQGNFKSSLNQKYGYGISFIPGVMLSDHTMAFARAGLVRSRFESKVTGAASQTKNITGGQLGLGVQTSLTSNLDLRGEYDYTAYRQTNFSNIGNKVSPRNDAFTVGLVYNID